MVTKASQPDQDAFTAGVELLFAKKYEAAAKAFEALGKRDDVPAQMIYSAGVYHRICLRKLNPPSFVPQNWQDHLDLATVHITGERFDQAASELAKARALKAPEDLVYYLEAGMACAQKNPGQAIKALHRAVDLNPYNAIVASNDPEFEPLADLDEFRKILRK